jgi:hypothetical protein
MTPNEMPGTAETYANNVASKEMEKKEWKGK